MGLKTPKPTVAVLFDDETLISIDAWCKAQPKKTTRPEAIRRLVRLGLDEELT